MSRWAKLLWFLVIAVALLALTLAIYFLSEEPKPSIPQPSGPPLAQPTSRLSSHTAHFTPLTRLP